MNPRLALAILLPFAALGLQWLLWPWIRPFVWFLFFPTVFFSARLGGYRGGLISTMLSAGIVWYFFLPPQLSWRMETPSNILSVAVFLLVGYLISESQDRLERAKRDTERALEEAHAAKEQITQLYRKTLELDELKTQFFANVSHELRTPLTLILSPIARHLAAPGLEPGLRHDLEVAERNARLLYRHVTDLLDVAKLEAGRMHLNAEQADLVPLTRAMTANFETLARERDIALEVEAPASLPARVDVEKIQRVLLNLLSNAIKFTPDGGTVRVTLNEADGAAVILVRDTGPGVPAEQRETIFEPFRQADGSVTRRFGGTGLGLAIVREFVELHGGTASVADAPGGGAQFRVSLPLPRAGDVAGRALAPEHLLDPELRRQALDELRPAGEVPAMPVAARDAPLVLIVEDNADMNAYLSDALGRHYRVAAARDGREGLERTLALRPDLILSDVMMPDMSGDELALALRAQPDMADVPIVMLTAKLDDDLRVKLLRAGVQDYVTKPFGLDELLARVGGLLAQRRRTRERLRESEARFEAAFEQAAVGIAMLAPDGRWLRVNRKLCEIVGYSQEELLSRTLQDITHPDDVDADLDCMRKMLARKIDTCSMEKRHIRKDGSIVWADFTVALAWKPDGEPDYLIAVIEDIQARKQAEEALRKFSRVIEQTASTVVITDADGVIEYVNPRFVETTGYTAEEALGKRPSLLKSGHTSQEQYADLWRTITAGRVWHGEFHNRRKDGSLYWESVTISPVRDAHGRITHFAGIKDDITERKQAEAALRELRGEMDQMLTLHVASQTAAAMAHELNQPLNAVASYTEAAVRLLHAGNPKPDRLLHALESSSRQAQRAGRVVRELLDFLQKGETTSEAVDLNDAVRRALAIVESNGFGGFHAVIDLAPDLRPVQANRLQVEKVLANLLRNGVEAMRSAGVLTQAITITVRTAADENMAQVTVRDSGPGLDEQTAQRIFQPFFTTKPRGIGMGLAISRTLIEAHGGRLWLDVGPGPGATFHFTLPYAP